MESVTLDSGTLACEVITYGAALRLLWVSDRFGGRRDIVLGYERLDEYENGHVYLGAVVGRVANRIAGGRFAARGQVYTLAVNDLPKYLHGGKAGFSHRVRSAVEHTPTLVTLALPNNDGEEGYTGTLQVRVTCALEGSSLSMRY